MLKADLELVEIPYTIKGPDGPLYADFHALRHTFVSMMERTGVSPKTAQALARHSDIRLTMNRYTHADKKALAEAVNRLPVGRATEHETDILLERIHALGSIGLAALDSLTGRAFADLFAHLFAQLAGTDGDGVRRGGQKASGGQTDRKAS